MMEYVKGVMQEREKSIRLNEYLRMKKENEEYLKEAERIEKETQRIEKLENKTIAPLKKHKKKKRNDKESAQKQEGSVIRLKSKEIHHSKYHNSEFYMSELSLSTAETTKTTNITKVTTNITKATTFEFESQCRICQSDEDNLVNQLTSPCGCEGSLKFVHMRCLKKWRQTKQSNGFEVSACELCKKNYNCKLLGKTDVKPNQQKQIQDDLRRIVKSGVYLMMLLQLCGEEINNMQG